MYHDTHITSISCEYFVLCMTSTLEVILNGPLGRIGSQLEQSGDEDLPGPERFFIKSVVLLLGRTGCMQAQKHYSDMQQFQSFFSQAGQSTVGSFCARKKMFLFSIQHLLFRVSVSHISSFPNEATSFHLKSLISCKV